MRVTLSPDARRLCAWLRQFVAGDERRHCPDCQTEWLLSRAERRRFLAQGLTLPKRCQPCRQLRRSRRGAEPGAPPQSGTS